MVKLYFSVFLLSLSIVVTAQTTIAVQDFETTPASPAWNYTSSGGTVSSVNTGTPANGRIRNGLNSFQSSNLASALTFDAIDISSYSNVKITVHVSSISGTGSNGADAADYVRLFTALNGNSFFTNTEANADIAVNGNTNARWSYASTGPTTNAGSNIVATATAGTNQGIVQSSLTIQIPNGTNTVALRINCLNNDVNEIWCIDDIEITGTPGGGSSITVLSSVSSFSSVRGVPSLEQSYTVSGAGLTGDISITAPPGFEISRNSGTNFLSTLTLTPSAGSVAGTTIYLRMNANSYGNVSGMITHSSTGASVQTISVNGNVLAEEPTAVSTVSFANVSANSMDINFSGGNGAHRLAVMNAGSPVTGAPIDGMIYNANPVFGSGATLGTNQFIVYNADANSVTVTGLNAGTTYYVAVFEYNDGAIPSASNYLSTSATGSQTTQIGAEGFQISATDRPFKIDFDSTVPGVSNGKFAGAGFSTTPGPGQMNSNSWSMTGWSDGALNFGGTRTTSSTDYTRGSSNGGVSTGGVYAFTVTPGNTALGFQPGGSDWAPGTVTLKIQNGTAVSIHNIELSYKLYVLNDQGRSSSFNFSWSNDNTSFTDVTTLNYSSVATADATPTWVANSKTISISGMSIAPGAFFYLRWNSADAGGSGTRDEFALDDIIVSANPSSPVILPVGFSEVKGIRKNESVILSWNNLTEEKLNRYEVQRSGNGNNFYSIDTIKPIKNDGGKASYTYIDQLPLDGNNFYRIKSIESNGKETYSIIVRINLELKSGGLLIYPNPVSGNSITIELNKFPKGRYVIAVYNISGQKFITDVMNYNGELASFSLPLNGVSAGIYVVKLEGPARLEKILIKN